jgi:hypothetical protein
MVITDLHFIVFVWVRQITEQSVGFTLRAGHDQSALWTSLYAVNLMAEHIRAVLCRTTDATVVDRRASRRSRQCEGRSDHIVDAFGG